MCVECYLSTDRDIADIPFDERNRKFNLQKIAERPLPCLTKRFVYSCGSNTYCGCEFTNSSITEELLQQTERELCAGALCKKTSMRWWNDLRYFPPPETLEQFHQVAEIIRMARNDTLALYGLIIETWKNGYASEFLAFWSGEQNCLMTIYDIDLRHDPIAIDFDPLKEAMGGEILLYRFPRV